MEALLVLLALVILAIPVLIIVLLVGQSGLKARVAELERRVRALSGDLLALQEAAPRTADTSAPEPPPPQPGAEPDAPQADLAATEPEMQPTPPEAGGEPAPDLPSPNPPPPGRWAPAHGEQAIGAPAAQPPSGPIVLRADRMAALGAWLQRNWIYVVSAASLALAGVFLVQYSVQNGLLPPEARVIAAYLFGLCLVGAGEWLRRRKGDGERSDTAYIPSVFAGAGIVTLFAATIAAEQLYGMIGPTSAFALHLATAALAVVLGWFYGPLLVAFGLLGAAASPFLISSSTGPTPLLYLFYALIALTGLAVDAFRRWAWVSALALVLAYGGGAMMLAGGAGQGPWLAFLLILPALAMAIPRLSAFPDHPGPSLLATLWTRGAVGWPEFPVRLAIGAVATSTLALLALQAEDSLVAFLALGALALLALALLVWAERADGLADLALLPALAFILRLLKEALNGEALAYDFWSQALNDRAPETAAPLTLTWVVALATLITATFAFRALKGGGLALVHGLAAVLVAPLAVAVLELTWAPALVLGDWAWALHPLALAALMVGLSGRFARADGPDHRRMAHAALSALSLIALALFILTSATALTLALAVLIVAAAWLDRRFDLREMGLFVQIGVAVLSWRLLIDPGVEWAMDGPLVQVIPAFAGPIAAYVAGLWLLRDRGRVMTSGVLDSAALGLTAILANVLLSRALVPPEMRDNLFDLAHVATLNAMPWLVLALTQVYRAGLGPMLRRTRRALAMVAGAIAGGLLLVSALPLNPLFASYEDAFGAKVTGPWLLDTLALAYALPAAVMLAAAWRMRLPRPLTIGLLGAGSAFAVLYAGLEIRRYWQGDWLGRPGVTEPELYTYTVALMLVGAVLLWQAILRRSHLLRRIAMAVIALVIAKVFLIDAAGLTGLTRVFSFLGLGLSLAGLAFVNRWADRQLSKDA